MGSKPLTTEEQGEFSRIWHNAGVMNTKYYTPTTTSKVARELLKLELIWNNGELYKFRAKSRGLGVYEMILVKT